ncbi:hypothetical protein TcWFU_005059 [Taenia crassiceps]|uniref:Uncharacterized protein n=1 Tax=Taenia crassiceps TaxID=6207 RepID=A0ABR4QKP0_9CEST
MSLLLQVLHEWRRWVYHKKRPSPGNGDSMTSAKSCHINSGLRIELALSLKTVQGYLIHRSSQLPKLLNSHNSHLSTLPSTVLHSVCTPPVTRAGQGFEPSTTLKSPLIEWASERKGDEEGLMRNASKLSSYSLPACQTDLTPSAKPSQCISSLHLIPPSWKATSTEAKGPPSYIQAELPHRLPQFSLSMRL